jgi:pilus assembly protein CpaF
MNAEHRALEIIKIMKNGNEDRGIPLSREDPKPLHPLDFVRQQIDLSPPHLKDRLSAEFFDFGPLQCLLADLKITELIINRNTIFFEKDGELRFHDDHFLTDFSFQQFVHKLCEESGVHTSLQHPYVDGVWRSFRLHMIQHPISDEKISITLRRQSREFWTLNRLQQASFVTDPQTTLLRDLYLFKKNILVVGATGSGKTTLINALLQETPPHERVIVIEDTDELIKPNPVSIKLLTRKKGLETLPDVALTELLRQTLRMRPDRILLGEVRSEEAKDLLLTLSTGHSGFLGTLHAKSSREALWRLEMLIQMGAPQWNLDTIRKLIFSSLHGIIVVGRTERRRQVTEMTRLAGLEAHGFLLEPLTALT